MFVFLGEGPVLRQQRHLPRSRWLRRARLSLQTVERAQGDSVVLPMAMNTF